MPRSHARILVSIWTDPDFRLLSVEAQRMYLVLLSQASLNNAGVLPLTVKRWSAACHATTTGDVEKALAELDDHRFVVVDDETEEVLVRSFIRNDGIEKQPQMLKNALKLATGVESVRLKTVLARELRRLGRDDANATADQLDPGHSPDPGPGDGSPIQAPRSLPAGFAQAPATPAEGSNETFPHSGSPQGAELRRGRGRGSSSSSVGSTQVGGAAKRGTRLPDDFEVTDAMKAWARQHTPLVGQAETDLFVDYWQSESGAKASKTDWRKAWQVWMRREQKAAERRPPHLRSVPAPVRPTDPSAAFDDLRGRAAAQEASRLLGIAYIPAPQPPSDTTPPQQWLRDRAVEFIDAHEQELRAALTERKTG